MRALVVHAHPGQATYSHDLRDAAVRGLQTGGHDVRVVDLYDDGFDPVMSPAERRAYHEDQPILDPLVATYAEHVQWADAMVFVYPTWTMGVPAMLKGWFEKTLVLGVAFHFDEKTHLVRPGLRHVKRLVGITTYGDRRASVFVRADGGRRTIMRTLRVVSARLCRRTWLGLYGIATASTDEQQAFLGRVERRMARL